MTDFGTLIYTDCRPGQGLTGGAGLQFQATSADVDGDAMAVVQRHLLYEPPSNWMRDQRPVAEYPPSFAHIGGDPYATAAGVYLGREANGTREGNQLTHAVATRDPNAYGLLRPAQLFGASFWTTKPAGTTRCDVVPGNPAPGILDTESVHAFVSSHPDGPRLLAALLTVLSQPEAQAPQVLFIADQVEPVLTWIAAATLLMPHRQALRIGFKVFTTTPTRSAQRVLAVHPDWDTPPASVERPGGYLVVDLLAARWSDIETEPLAGRWAESFCAGDPFDVTDAVELAAGSRLEPATAAMSLARVAVLGEPPEAEHAEAVVGWLTEGPQDLVTAYGAPVAAAFTTDVANQPLGLLRKLDRATRGGGFDDQAVPVRLALLGAELRDAARTGDAPDALVPPVTDREWGDAAAGRALRLTLDALKLAHGAGFAAMLGVAGRFAIPVRYADIGPAADRFIDEWARRPGLAHRRKGWPCGAEFEDRLRDHLNGELAAGTVAPAAVGDAWSAVLRIKDPVAALDAALVSARMAGQSEGERIALVTTLLDYAATTPDPAHQVTALGRCLWRRTPPTTAELRAFADAAPDGAEIHPDAVGGYLTGRITDGTLDAADLKLAAAMAADGRLRPTSGTADLLRSELLLQQVCRELPELEKPDPKLTRRLNGTAHAVIRVHRDALIEALLNTSVPETVAAVVDMMQPSFQQGYAVKAAVRLSEKPAAQAVATAMVVASRTRDERTARKLLEAVNSWASWAGSGPVDKVSALLNVPGFKPAYARWLELLETNRIRRGRSWLRGSRGR